MAEQNKTNIGRDISPGVHTTLNPIGVVCGIGAWNYPATVLVNKLAPALATGNVFIEKPSEHAPLVR